MLKLLDREIDKLEQQIRDLIKSCDELQTMKNIIVGQKGIGDATAHYVMATLPELGDLTRRQITSLAGLAPHPKDSGQIRGHRTMRGGRRHIKSALFMAAMSAAKTNPQIRPFYDSLISRGKKPMVALGAVMRKIITILNAKIRDHNLQINKQS